jgi:hypothetical protein
LGFFFAKPGFIPEVESHLKKINLDSKVLLLLDNAPGHPNKLNHPNVKVIFLPPNTTSLIQPIDQGIIATFNHLKHTTSEELSSQFLKNSM